MKRFLFSGWVALVAAAAFAACGGSGDVGSSVSVDITSPAETSNVDVTSAMVATITDPNAVGITVPASWSSVFTLKQVGTDTNLCTDDLITYDAAAGTITCQPATLGAMAQFGLSVSGMTDANGLRIDPSSLAFQTGAI